MADVASLYDDIFPEPPALAPQSAAATAGAGSGDAGVDSDDGASPSAPAPQVTATANSPAAPRPKNVPRVKGVQVPPKRRPTYLSMITRLLKEQQRDNLLAFTSRSKIDDALWAQWFAGGKAAPTTPAYGAAQAAPPLSNADAPNPAGDDAGGDISREAFRARLRTALADAVASGMLLQKKQSFRLPKQSLTRGRRRAAKKGAASGASKSSRAKRPATADARAEDSDGNNDGGSNEGVGAVRGELIDSDASPRADTQPAKRNRTAAAKNGKKRSSGSRSQPQSQVGTQVDVPTSSAAASS